MARRDATFQITSASPAASVERQFRVRRYLFSMSVRTVCFLAAIAIQGWIGLLLMGAAVVLPYISVVLANQVTRSRPVGLPPLIIKDTAELPVGHPDRTEPAF